MNDFKGLSTATSTVKTPEQMWQFARNILLSKKYLSIVNEKGNEYGYDVPGTVIGFEVTNETIVYFSIDDGFSCIGYVDVHVGSYTRILRTKNPKFKFNLNSPIECVSIYNYKKELIVVFSDGVNTNSSSPKLININNPQKKFSPSGEFLSDKDYLVFELFTPNKLPHVDISYTTGGSLDAEVIHIAMAYVYDDNTEGLPTPILDTVYPNFKGLNKIKRNVIINLVNFSLNFSKIKLLFIIETGGARFAYETPVLNIINNRVSYNLSAVNNLTISDTGKVLLAYERFNKIKTLTKTANQITAGWVTTEDNKNFQKYANKLELKFNLITDSEELERFKSHPTFLPDEVYSFKFIPLFLNGSRGDAFHIPGPKGTADDIAILTEAEINSYGLNISKYKNKKYRKFHFNNSGLVHTTNKWGHWQNEEVYPNHEDYNASSIGGEDLRGTPIRYHRFPSPEAFVTYGGGNTLMENKPLITNGISDNLDKYPKFNIYIDNLHNAFPADILNTLQGYEIVFEKRVKGGTYIEFTGLLYTMGFQEGTTVSIGGGKLTFNGSQYKDFTNSNFISIETAKERVEVTAQLSKVYNGVKLSTVDIEKDVDYFTGNTATTPFITPVIKTNYKFANIVKSEYKLANNIQSGNKFREERLQLHLQRTVSGDSEVYEPIEHNVIRVVNLFNLNAALITLNKNIYNLENGKDFISVGKVIFTENQATNEKLVNGDVFKNNILLKSYSMGGAHDGLILAGIYSYLKYYVLNLYSPLSNHYIGNGDKTQEGRNWFRDHPDHPEDVNRLNAADYTTIVKNTNNHYFNDLEGTLSYGLTLNYVNKFPYRIYKGLSIPNESLNTANLRTFLTNQYYDMPNDRGEIIALRGFNNGLFIQQRYSLYRTTISDKLDTDISQVYLGNTELFDRLPEELISNNNIGYIGSNNQFACTTFRDGYVTVDEVQGKVFLVNNSVEELSLQNVKDGFREKLPLKRNYTKKDLLNKTVIVDNPYNSIGYLVGFDEEFNRLLITKKYYEPKETTSQLNFDGEFYTRKNDGSLVDFKDIAYFTDESFTYSYALDSKTWVCLHDYTPSFYYYTNKGLYSVINTLTSNAKQYKHNSNNVNPGNYYGKQYEAYVDLIFNGRLDLIKQHQAVYWVSESMDIKNERLVNQFDTIDKIMLYNNHQCSDFINVSKKSLEVSRNVEGIWQFNEFRDMVINPNAVIVDKDGRLNESNIKAEKQWYNKNMFIGNYIVVRLVWNNDTSNLKYIHNVNVKSVVSKR